MGMWDDKRHGKPRDESGYLFEGLKIDSIGEQVQHSLPFAKGMKSLVEAPDSGQHAPLSVRG